MKICITGDIMQHSRQHISEKSRNFSYENLFSTELLDIFNSCDLVIGQLETNCTNTKEVSGFPKFNANENFLTALKDSGFDALCFANNHSLDHGFMIFNETIMNIEKNKMQAFGHITLDRNIKIGDKIINLINFTNITNCKEVGYTWNSLRTKENTLQNIRFQQNAINIVIFHDGEEYSKKITDSQHNTFVELFKQAEKQKCQIHAIISNHSHVVGTLNDFNARGTTYLSNGLGNLISWQESLDKQIGMLIVLDFHENQNTKVKKIYTETIFDHNGFQQVRILEKQNSSSK